MLTHKNIYLFLSSFFLASILFNCKKKEETKTVTTSTTTTTSPTYSPTSTTGSSTLTVTGTSTVSNPATQNTALQVSSTLPGWTFDSCSVSSNTLTARNGTTTIQLTLGGGVATGSYVLGPNIPLAAQARIIVSDAPGQPNGVLWYSKSGIVNVVAGSTVTASFNNIQCLQYSYLFPVVTLSGDLRCL